MRGILASIILANLLWLAGACSDTTASRSVPATPVGRGVTLEVELPYDGLVLLRSPTFR